MGFAAQYMQNLATTVGTVDAGAVDGLTDLLEEVWRNGGRVMLMGNGGSGSTASHIVNDLQKCIGLDTGKAIKALCLCDCTALILAWGNDTSYDNIFAPQVECWAEPGDLVIGISGSGNSPNVLNAMEAAKKAGATAFGLAGYGGGKLAGIADRCITLASTNMQLVEDVHMAILHAAFAGLRLRLTAG
jgi:D-sedoheptulose 7-phosphate isomerase